MEIKNITLNDGKPVTVLAELSFDEAVYLGLVTGSMNWDMAEKILPDAGPNASNNIYDCVSDLLNRFYEGGIREAARYATRYEWPPKKTEGER
jgi:hypothetical protein